MMKEIGELVSEMTMKVAEHKEEVLKKAVKHFQINLGDIPDRVGVEITPRGELYYIDGKLAIEWNKDLDFTNGKMTMRYKEHYKESTL